MLRLVDGDVVELEVGALEIIESEVVVGCSVLLIEALALSICAVPSIDSDRAGRS